MQGEDIDQDNLRIAGEGMQELLAQRLRSMVERYAQLDGRSMEQFQRAFGDMPGPGQVSAHATLLLSI